jgi:hypothetical protein
MSLKGCVSMHAVFIEVELSDVAPEEGRKYLREQIAPTVQGLAGFRTGIWLNRDESGPAMSITIWDKLDQAEAMVKMFGPEASARAGGVVRRCEISKVAASAFCYFSPGTTGTT